MMYSVEQVADLLGLHVKTVRSYVRDGRLKAVRIGKQYRIAREDLEAFTGQPVEPSPRESAGRTRHVEVSSIVQVDAIDRAGMSRLTTAAMAAAQNRPDGDPQLRIQSIYDEERASLKVIVVGGPASVAAILTLLDDLAAQS